MLCHLRNKMEKAVFLSFCGNKWEMLSRRKDHRLFQGRMEKAPMPTKITETVAITAMLVATGMDVVAKPTVTCRKHSRTDQWSIWDNYYETKKSEDTVLNSGTRAYIYLLLFSIFGVLLLLGRIIIRFIRWLLPFTAVIITTFIVWGNIITSNAITITTGQVCVVLVFCATFL